MRSKALEARIGGVCSLWRLGAIALMLGLASVLAACAQEPEEEAASTTSEEEAESEGPAAGVVISDITDNPQEFFGTTVTISGEVNELVGPQAFTIGGEDFLGTDELLIVGAQKLPNVIEGVEGEVEVGEDDIVQVTGTVRQFESVTKLEEDLGYELDDNLFGEFQGEPVVVAEKVFLTPHAERAGEQGVGADISDITDAPEEFYGQTLAVEGIVGETVEANAFVLIDEQQAGGGDARDGTLAAEEGVLVVNSDNFRPNLSEGQRVRVKGKFQQFDRAAFEDELGIKLENDPFREFAGRPAILVQQIQTI